MASTAPTPKTICYMDLEGHERYPVEIGLVLVDRERQEITNAEVFYGRVCDFKDFLRSQRYCHGLSYHYLESNGYGSYELCKRVARLLCDEWKPDEIVANGDDCQRYLRQQAGVLFIPFRNCLLPPWNERDRLVCHKAAFHMKANSLCVDGKVSCNWEEVHHYPIHSTNILKEAHGAHCSLYDALEVALFENVHLMNKLAHLYQCDS